MFKFLNKYFFFSLLVLFVSSCVHTGEFKEQVPFTANLNSYNNVFLSATSENAENAKLAESFQKYAVADITDAAFFKSISATPASGQDLEIALKLTNYVGGSNGLRALHMGGESVIEFHGQFIDLKTKKILGTFDLSGNSARKSEVSIQGVNTSWGDALEYRAVLAATEQLENFIKDKKGLK